MRDPFDLSQYTTSFAKVSNFTVEPFKFSDFSAVFASLANGIKIRQKAISIGYIVPETSFINADGYNVANFSGVISGIISFQNAIKQMINSSLVSSAAEITTAYGSLPGCPNVRIGFFQTSTGSVITTLNQIIPVDAPDFPNFKNITALQNATSTSSINFAVIAFDYLEELRNTLNNLNFMHGRMYHAYSEQTDACVPDASPPPPPPPPPPAPPPATSAGQLFAIYIMDDRYMLDPSGTPGMPLTTSLRLELAKKVALYIINGIPFDGSIYGPRCAVHKGLGLWNGGNQDGTEPLVTAYGTSVGGGAIGSLISVGQFPTPEAKTVFYNDISSKFTMSNFGPNLSGSNGINTMNCIQGLPFIYGSTAGQYGNPSNKNMKMIFLGTLGYNANGPGTNDFVPAMSLVSSQSNSALAKYILGNNVKSIPYFINVGGWPNASGFMKVQSFWTNLITTGSSNCSGVGGSANTVGGSNYPIEASNYPTTTSGGGYASWKCLGGNVGTIALGADDTAVANLVSSLGILT